MERRAGDIGSQALAEGAVDELQLGVVPVLFGSGKRFFRTATEQMIENPRIIAGDRVVHLVYTGEAPRRAPLS